MEQKIEAPLTLEQRRLVEENMGLVGLNLRRFRINPNPPRSTRERDDLYQEGCLALIRAARTYPPDSHIPFASYALPRIRNAIALTLERGFCSVKFPIQRRGRDSRRIRRSDKEKRRPFQIITGEIELLSRPDWRRHHPGEPEEGERIGDRIRDRYDRALRRTVERMQKARDQRGDLAGLVNCMAQERWMLPAEEARVSLREIAARTRSSYARVHGCEQRMARMVREALDEDPVFCSVRNEALQNEDGVEARVNEAMEQRIRKRLEEACLVAYGKQEPAQRMATLSRLIELGEADDSALVSRLLASLSEAAFETLLEEWSARPHIRNRRLWSKSSKSAPAVTV